jgi:hypothetical protein
MVGASQTTRGRRTATVRRNSQPRHSLSGRLPRSGQSTRATTRCLILLAGCGRLDGRVRRRAPCPGHSQQLDDELRPTEPMTGGLHHDGRLEALELAAAALPVLVDCLEKVTV